MTRANNGNPDQPGSGSRDDQAAPATAALAPYVLRNPLGEPGGQVVIEFETDAQMIAVLARFESTPPDLAVGGTAALAQSDLADVFERPFTDPDDPRLRCAKVLTKSEAEAVLEFRGDLVAVLTPTPPPSTPPDTDAEGV